MAIKDAPRVRETTTTTGTGTIDLSGAVLGFQSFVSGVGTGNSVYYTILAANGTDWEVGLGTVTDATPDTLSRAVIKSSNANALLSLAAGTHSVFLSPTPGYATGDVNFSDLILQRPELKDYAETGPTPTISANAITLDLETGNHFIVNHNANLITVTISNPPVSGKVGSFTLWLTQDATGGRTLTLPSSCKPYGGSFPTLTTTTNALNILSFCTKDGGTTWLYNLSWTGTP
jgi:hypothetical protein